MIFADHVKRLEKSRAQKRCLQCCCIDEHLISFCCSQISDPKQDKFDQLLMNLQRNGCVLGKQMSAYEREQIEPMRGKGVGSGRLT